MSTDMEKLLATFLLNILLSAPISSPSSSQACVGQEGPEAQGQSSANKPSCPPQADYVAFDDSIVGAQVSAQVPPLKSLSPNLSTSLFIILSPKLMGTLTHSL